MMHTIRQAAAALVASACLASTASTASAAAPAADVSDADLAEYLSAQGIDDALVARFADGKPLDDAERRPLVLALAAMKKCTPADLSKYAKPAAGPDAFAAKTAKGKLWALGGRLKSIRADKFTDEECALVYPELDEVKADDPRRTFYRCELETGDAKTPLTAVSLRVPKQLAGQDKLDARSGVEGLYVKHVGAAPGEKPVLVAAHLAWYPSNLLGELGMDVALLDDVRDNVSNLSQVYEPYYRLLAAMKRADFDALLEATKGEHSVEPLFNRPAEARGKLISLIGDARRAVEVRVTDEVRARFGIDRHYEVHLYTRDSQNNPLVFQLLELPPGFPQGDDIHERVRIPGVFLTGWIYQRDATIEERSKGIRPPMQKEPLLIGKSLVRVEYVQGEGEAFNWLMASLVLGGIVALGVSAVFYRRREGRAREIRERINAPPAGTSLNDLPLEYRSSPDFSKLEEGEGTRER